MVLTAESVKGRAILPLLIQPSMLIASHLAALLQAGSGNLSGTAAGYPRAGPPGSRGAEGSRRAARGDRCQGQLGPLSVTEPPVTAGCFISEHL